MATILEEGKKMAIIWSPSLDSEARQWRDAAREIAHDILAPQAAQIDREQRYPHDSVKLLHERGICTMFLPEQYGGAGASLTAFCAVIEELAQACPSTSAIVATFQLGALPLLSATPEQQSLYLTTLTQQRTLISFALTECSAGSDPCRMKTSATPDNGGWRLQGEKRWVGGAGQCAYYLVFAQTNPGSGRHGIAAFIVEASAEGVTTGMPEDKMGMRGTVNCTVKFDTWVSQEAMVLLPGKAIKVGLNALNVGRTAVAAQSNGIALAAFNAAAGRACDRRSFDRPIIEHQGIGFALADVATKLSAGRMLAYETAHRFDTAQDVAHISAQAKLFCSEAAHDAVDMALQIFGAEGFVKPSLVERLYRDQRATEIYEGTSEIQRVVLARAIQAEFNHQEHT